MKIIPSENIVYVKVEVGGSGVLDHSSRVSVIEFGEVLGVGEGVKGYKKGDKIMFKSWGMDSTTYKDERYCFININTGSILCTFHENLR